MIEPGQVTAVIPTRGDVDMSRQIASLEEAGYGQIIVWDNSQREDFGIYSRWVAIDREARFPVIYTQDDDYIFAGHAELLSHYRPGRLTVNYMQPWNIPWIGCGAVFDADLHRNAFSRYLAKYPLDRLFTHQICEGVFCAMQNDVLVLQIGIEELPWATAGGRVSTTDGWYDRDRPQIFQRVAEI